MSAIRKSLLVIALAIVALAGIPTASAGSATSNGCSAFALSAGTSYSAGMTYPMWARATSTCPYRVNYKLELKRDVLGTDMVLATTTGTTSAGGTFNYTGTRVNCGTYATSRNGKYYSKITIS